MSIGLLFWIVFILSLLGGAGWAWPRDEPNRRVFGSWLVVFLLVGLLGWAAFGAPLKG